MQSEEHILCLFFVHCSPVPHNSRSYSSVLVASGFRESFHQDDTIKSYNLLTLTSKREEYARCLSDEVTHEKSYLLGKPENTLPKGKNGMFSCFLALDIFKLVYSLEFEEHSFLTRKNTSLLIWFLLWHLSCSRLCNFY